MLGIAAGLCASLYAGPISYGITEFMPDGGDRDFLGVKQVARTEQSWVLPYPKIKGPMVLHDTWREHPYEGGPTKFDYVSSGFTVEVPHVPYGYWCLWRLAEELCNRREMHPGQREISAACDSLIAENHDVFGKNPNLIRPGMVFEFTTKCNYNLGGNW